MKKRKKIRRKNKIDFNEIFIEAMRNFNKEMRETRRIITSSIRKTNGVIWFSL